MNLVTSIVLSIALLAFVVGYNISSTAPFAYFSFNIDFENSGDDFKTYYEDLYNDIGNLTSIDTNKSIIISKDRLSFDTNGFFFPKGSETKLSAMLATLSRSMCAYKPFRVPVKSIDYRGNDLVTFAQPGDEFVARPDFILIYFKTIDRKTDNNFVSDFRYFPNITISVCDTKYNDPTCRIVGSMPITCD